MKIFVVSAKIYRCFPTWLLGLRLPINFSIAFVVWRTLLYANFRLANMEVIMSSSELDDSLLSLCLTSLPLLTICLTRLGCSMIRKGQYFLSYDAWVASTWLIDIFLQFPSQCRDSPSPTFQFVRIVTFLVAQRSDKKKRQLKNQFQ